MLNRISYNATITAPIKPNSVPPTLTPAVATANDELELVRDAEVVVAVDVEFLVAETLELVVA